MSTYKTPSPNVPGECPSSSGLSKPDINEQDECQRRPGCRNYCPKPGDHFFMKDNVALCAGKRFCLLVVCFKEVSAATPQERKSAMSARYDRCVTTKSISMKKRMRCAYIAPAVPLKHTCQGDIPGPYQTIMFVLPG